MSVRLAVFEVVTTTMFVLFDLLAEIPPVSVPSKVAALTPIHTCSDDEDDVRSKRILVVAQVDAKRIGMDTATETTEPERNR